MSRGFSYFSHSFPLIQKRKHESAFFQFADKGCKERVYLQSEGSTKVLSSILLIQYLLDDASVLGDAPKRIVVLRVYINEIYPFVVHYISVVYIVLFHERLFLAGSKIEHVEFAATERDVHLSVADVELDKIIALLDRLKDDLRFVKPQSSAR